MAVAAFMALATLGLVAFGGRFTQPSRAPVASYQRTSLLTAKAVAPVPPRALPDGAVVELWHNGRLHLGNSRGLASPKTLLVELSSGERVKIDGGQLVDVWQEDADAPTCVAEWKEVHCAAASLLAQLPPQVLDLQPLWKQLVTRKGGSECLASCQVAEALFDGIEVKEQEAGAVVGRVARRLAAAQLLAEERVLFKRQQGELLALAQEDADAAPCCILRNGGFKPLPKAQAESRAEGLLLEGLRRTLQGEPANWAPAVLPLLAELEMAALGVRNTSKLLQRTLAALGEPPSPAGARQLLVRSGQWQEDADALPEAGGQGAEASARARLFSLETFPRAVLDAAEAAAADIAARRAAYAALPLTPPPEPLERTPFAEYVRLSLEPPRPSAAKEPAAAAADADALDGRLDLRTRCPRVYAIDSDSTDFRDDAISIDLSTGELYVHVADVSATVRPGDALDETARLRLQSVYASAMPLHMLPPRLLHRLCLSTDQPNECVTAILKLDAFGKARSLPPLAPQPSDPRVSPLNRPCLPPRPLAPSRPPLARLSPASRPPLARLSPASRPPLARLSPASRPPLAPPLPPHPRSTPRAARPPPRSASAASCARSSRRCAPSPSRPSTSCSPTERSHRRSTP